MKKETAGGAEDDLVTYSAELSDRPEASSYLVWKILIVDDDPQVHTVTLLALSKLTIHERRLQFLHAYTAEEAFRTMRQESDVAVILLDVVMEKDDAGLIFVKRLRDELQNHAVRIILRTGQPGYAPELTAIQDYDINDYKTKSELTRTRLITSITTAIRSYDQFQSVLRQQTGMEEIVLASSRLLSHHTIQPFAVETLRQIAEVLHQSINSLIVLANTNDIHPETSEIICGTGDFISHEDRPLSALPSERLRDTIIEHLANGAPSFGSLEIMLPMSEENTSILIYLELSHPLQFTESKLLDVLLTNISVVYRNICLIQRLELQAYYDTLTGLMNATKLIVDIDRVISNKTQNMQLIAIDVDSFSEINDALGYEHGNELLQLIAMRLRTHFISAFTLARVSGDTFCILGQEDHLQPQLVFSILDEPFQLYDTSSTIPFTLGIVQLNDFTGHGSDAVNKAILAMKQAKRNARLRFLYFSRTMQDAIQTRVTITRSLKPALLNNEFVLHYQPQVEVDRTSGKVLLKGVEALIRWQRSPDQLTSPNEFIPTAESTGLINEIGRWVVRKAFAQAKYWKETLPHPIRVSINVSMKQFYSPSFLPFMNHVLQETGIPADLIELEITESLVMQDAERMIATLKSLKEQGFRIAIDDFGTGFSSMNYLLRLPIDRLKIDRSFIANVTTNARSRSLTQFLIQLGHQLGLEIIAEGIETEEQLAIITELDCYEFQGFLFSRPRPDNEIADILTSLE